MSTISVIEDNREARDAHGHAWGSEEFVMTKEHVQALLDGQCVAIFDGEYVSFLTLEQPSK